MKEGSGEADAVHTYQRLRWCSAYRAALRLLGGTLAVAPAITRAQVSGAEWEAYLWRPAEYRHLTHREFLESFRLTDKPPADVETHDVPASSSTSKKKYWVRRQPDRANTGSSSARWEIPWISNPLHPLWVIAEKEPAHLFHRPNAPAAPHESRRDEAAAIGVLDKQAAEAWC